MKRLPGEDFEEYRERRKKENKARKFIGRTLRWITPKPKEKPVVPKTPPTNKAVGKRHKNEPLPLFRDRRKTCNAKRRRREKLRRYSLTVN